MDAVGLKGGSGGSLDGWGSARCEELRQEFEWHIDRIERACCQEDTRPWEEAVIALRDAAASAGADRIVATASSLLDVEPSDDRAISDLLNRLSSEARISALEEVCRLQEEALAAELSALRPVTGRHPE